MGAQQSIKRKRRTTSRTSRTSLTSRTSSTSRGGKDNFVDVASFDFRREEMDAEMEYRKDYFQSRFLFPTRTLSLFLFSEKWVVYRRKRENLVQRD